MEKMVKTGEQAQTEVPSKRKKKKQMEDESKALLKQYDAALLRRWRRQRRVGPH
jgi:hypothetical protein